MDCPCCNFYIEEAIELQYSVGDKITCPSCKNILIKYYDDCYDEEGNDIGSFYLNKM